MFAFRFAAVAAAAALVAGVAAAQQKFPAALAGHSVLPAASFVDPPADAPEAFRVSGKFAGPGNRRVEAVGSIAGATGSGAGTRPTGMSFPFTGQPVQGFSGIKPAGDGSYWVLTDNGFGNKFNSPDALLMFHRVRPDWTTGQVARLETKFLHDPDRVIPFQIVTDGTAKRYLTGADFDIESIQPIGDAFWFGDEFGPYLLRTDAAGKVTGFWETRLGDKPLRSPDHFSVRTPGAPGPVAFEVRRSKGYEGMAASPDGKFLYAMLEGALWDAAANATEKFDGREGLRVLEFSTADGAWTGKSWVYPLDANGNSIGDFNMIDAERALVIERDDGEGDPVRACPSGQPAATCFATPARFKRIYVVSMAGVASGAAMRKLGYIDLMEIADPAGKSRQGGGDGRFSFPFFTIENVAMVDGEHIIVGNDNNLPFSAGRALDRADDNEFVLLRVPELLAAR